MSCANPLTPAAAAPLAPSAAGFLPTTPASEQTGKKSPPLVETRPAADETSERSQAAVPPLLGSAAACGPLETGAAAPTGVSYRGENDPSEEADERAEQRALIAEGVAMLVRGARAQRRGGRPTVIDAELKAKVAALMGAGLSMRQAAAFLGISHPTISKAIQEDPELKEEVELARTRATLHPLACILRESGKNWKAAVWLLEHLRSVAYLEKTPLEKAEHGIEPRVVMALEDELKPRRIAEAQAACGRGAGRLTGRPR